MLDHNAVPVPLESRIPLRSIRVTLADVSSWQESKFGYQIAPKRTKRLNPIEGKARAARCAQDQTMNVL